MEHNGPRPPKKPRDDTKPKKKSVWDQIKRTELKFADLDLNKSYVEELKEAQQKKREEEEKEAKERGLENVEIPPRKRRLSFQDMPIYNVENLPADWSAVENDIADNDIKAQIDRCFERLDESIMPHFFEQRLQSLMMKEEEMLKTQSLQDPDLTPLEAARVANLEALWELLRNQGDKNRQLINIENILEAYRSGKLRWTGLVTYWSHGKQICQPRMFNWDEFEVINKECKGSKSFWTEGLDGPGPEQMNYRMVISPSTYHQFLHTYRVAFRLPGFNWYEELEVLYDTGATMARIYEQDVINLQGPFSIADHDINVVGSVRAQEFTTFTGDQVIMVEVCLINPRRPTQRETSWVRIQCAVTQGACPADQPKRLDGPWLRHVMHHAIEPNGRNEIQVANSKRNLKYDPTYVSMFRRPDQRMPRVPLTGGDEEPFALQVPARYASEALGEEPPPYEAVEGGGGAPPKAGKGLLYPSRDDIAGSREIIN